jgi:hypothetical protein
MLKGLRQLGESFPIKHRCLVSRDPVERVEEGITFLPYQKFLTRLWSGDWFV